MNSQSEGVSIDTVENTSKSLVHEQVERLEATVAELVTLCKKLSEDNNTYKGSNQQLLLERSELQSKNDKVRGQVEAMVNRLKAVDKAS